MESHGPNAHWIALLDEDVLRSGAIHDTRGVLTALWARLDIHAPPDPTRELLLGRLADLLRELGRAEGAAWPEEVFWGALAQIVGADARARAREALERSGRATLEDVPADGLLAGWSLEGVRGWIAAGDPSLLGARLRVSARRCGVQLSARPTGSGAHAHLTITRVPG